MNPTTVPNSFAIQHIDGCNTTLHGGSPNSRDALLDLAHTVATPVSMACSIRSSVAALRA